MYASFVVRAGPRIGYTLQGFVLVANISVTYVCARSGRDGILVASEIPKINRPVQSAINSIFHRATDGCVRLRVLLHQLRAPVLVGATDVLDERNQRSMRIPNTDPPKFIVMFAAGSGARTVKFLDCNEPDLRETLPKFVDSAQPRIASNEHFRRWRIGLALQGFQAALKMAGIGCLGSVADYGDHNRKTWSRCHSTYSTSIKARPGPNA